MKNTYVAITGYYGTGSSAVIDLLKEYERVGIAAPTDPYEHMAFYSPGALFDLSSILLGPFCSAYTSDMAINRFISAANRLNNNNFGWFGSYKAYYGSKYSQIVQEFISSISECKSKKRKNAAHVEKVRFSLFKCCLQIGAKLIYNRPINKWGNKYVYDSMPGYLALPTKEEFSAAAKQYTSSYMGMCSNGNKLEVFDHLIWPQQVDSLDVLFPNNFKVIVVQRDPRDVYLLNKYYWHQHHLTTGTPYFSTDPRKFIDEWKRTIYINDDNKNVLYVYFEDLIYRYDSCLYNIESFLKLEPNTHKYYQERFKPLDSIENTQIYNVSEDWKKEVSIIESELKDYLYDFPYNRIPNKDLWFDA